MGSSTIIIMGMPGKLFVLGRETGFDIQTTKEAKDKSRIKQAQLGSFFG